MISRTQFCWLLLGLLVVVNMTARFSFSGSTKKVSAPMTMTQNSLWVAISDGSLSCGEAPGRTLEEDQKKLEAAGVQVFQAKKTSDGKMHIQVCGAATGRLNSFLIKNSDVKKAADLGFK